MRIKLNDTLFQYNCELYHSKIWITNDAENFRKLFVYNDDNSVPVINSDDYKACVVSVLKNIETRYLGIGIWLSDETDLGTIVHECVHVASDLFKRIGSTHDLDNEETYAYLLEWVFEKVYEAWQILISNKQKENSQNSD